MKKRVKTEGCFRQRSLRDWLLEERGESNIIAIILIIVVVVILVGIFNKQLQDIVTGLFDKIREGIEGIK